MGSHHPIRKTVTPEPVAIPDKLYFRIGDVARLCDVPPYVLRFWETEFSQLKPNKGGTGQRLYRKKDVEMALRIKSLLYDQGYTIPGARQAFKADANPTESILEAAAPAPTSAIELSTPHAAQKPASEKWSAPPETYDRGAELRLRAQLADLRDDLQSVLDQLSRPLSPEPAEHSPPPPAATVSDAAVPAAPAITGVAASKPRPRLVLEPKPVIKTAAQTTLHLTTQGDLFGLE